MTPDGMALALAPAPRSVPRARRWVAEVCRANGRDDLVDSAESGVSELVTNALLHAPGPINVRVSGTTEHPRFEVQDTSPIPPRPPRASPPATPPDSRLLSTVGRGLRILAAGSTAWGTETSADGKIVWFEPASEPRSDLTDDELAGLLHVAAPHGDGPGSPGWSTQADSGTDLVTVRLLGVPVARFAQFRRHHLELRRELRLLGLAHAADYPQAERLAALFTDFEQDFGPAVDAPELLDAIEAGESYADLSLLVPASAPSATEQMVRLLDLADEFCAAARLLTLARTADQAEFERWFLTQIGAQAAGAPAVAWGESAGAGRASRYVPR